MLNDVSAVNIDGGNDKNNVFSVGDAFYSLYRVGCVSLTF